MTWFRKRSSAPLWRDEFSVFTADERYVNRRQFAKFLTLTSLGMFAGNAWILVRSWLHRPAAYPERAVAAVGETPVGGVKTFSYPTADDPCILVRLGQDAYVAYSQKCTHLSCAVYYSKERNQFACPCHQGCFSVSDGAPVQGPPRRPLPRVALERRGGQLVAIGMEGGGA
jgi:Rieske Fe-S protein